MLYIIITKNRTTANKYKGIIIKGVVANNGSMNENNKQGSIIKKLLLIDNLSKS